MKKSYSQTPKSMPSRESIIGLGESSFRKNYYPELQEKLLDLERINIRNRALITTIPDFLLVSDIEGHITPFSTVKLDTFPLLSGILCDKFIMTLLKNEITHVAVTRTLNTCNFSYELAHQLYHFEARIHISELDEILIIIRDMTERTLLEDQLREAALTDSLTGLYNRRYFEEQLSNYHDKEHSLLTLILLDIDGLKLMNDTLGHMAGDQLIISMANLITELFHDIGLTSRIGGDEFGVLLTGISPEEIEKLLNRLVQEVYLFNENSDTLKLTLSYGYSHHVSGIVNSPYMYQESDNNMYQTKLLKTSSTRSNIVKTLMKALEVRDYITEGHADRMGQMATNIGMALGLKKSMIDRIQLLTKFHDIGKVGIPDAILKKPGILNASEYKIMQTHSAIGERIANESSELKEIAHLILKHHEKWDGTGYPLGLMGYAIPLECRILAIVDAYDAMTNDRPYRKALSQSTATEEIIQHSGTQFDPLLVEYFLTIEKD